MNERLLQFIWQYQYFNMSDLQTTAGDAVQVIRRGEFNTNQGPDFSNAKIKIADAVWAGTVELHVLSSDWQRHRHQHDRNYDNVILHVVWEEDSPAGALPVLELKGRVPGLLLKKYETLLQTGSFIPCEKSIKGINDLVLKSWQDRLLAERLERKSAIVHRFLSENGNHWEETTWWLLARNFGTRVNSDAFEAIARSLPLSLLHKQKHQLILLESLLMGQAGLLREEKAGDSYYTLLRREYLFQQKKYNLQPIALPIHFLRMRPVNFPTVRLAQMAAFLQQADTLFTGIREATDPASVSKWFDVTANDYWHYHYNFDHAAEYKPKRLGATMTETLLINAVIPLLFAWGVYSGDPAFKEKAISWLEQLPPEINQITRSFTQLGIENKTAFDSQALLEMKNEYCREKRCLECGVGSKLMSLEFKV